MKKQMTYPLLAGLFLLSVLTGCSAMSRHIVWSLPKPNFATLPLEKTNGLLVSNLKYIYLDERLDYINPNMPQPSVGALIASNLRGQTDLEVWRKVFAGEEVTNALQQFPEEERQVIIDAFNSASINLKETKSLSVMGVASTTKGGKLDGFYSEISHLHPASDFPYASHEKVLKLAKKLGASYLMTGFVWVDSPSYPAARETELVGALIKQQRKMVGDPVTSHVGGVGFAYKRYDDGLEALMIKAEISVGYRIIEVKSGRIVFANTIKGDYNFTGNETPESPIPAEFKTGGEIQTSLYAKAAWMHACEDVSEKLIKEIEKNWAYIYQLEGEIQTVNAQGITVSLGKTDGLMRGTYLAVFNAEDTALSQPVAFLKVKDVQDASCIAEFEQGDISGVQPLMKAAVSQPSLFQDK
jgi:hypothetical protein